jgi:hypothetical protein
MTSSRSRCSRRSSSSFCWRVSISSPVSRLLMAGLPKLTRLPPVQFGIGDARQVPATRSPPDNIPSILAQFIYRYRREARGNANAADRSAVEKIRGPEGAARRCPCPGALRQGDPP